jgi:hypothetical protein
MLALLLTALATQVDATWKVFNNAWPDNIPQPLAYYWFNEGNGTKLKESVSGVSDAGYVEAPTKDQPLGQYPGPTWIVDPYFGNVFQCGNPDTGAKDVLRLADVDYGSTGKFTINWWIRNPVGSDFEDREKEQIFGHGDPEEITSAPNVIHVQMENLHLQSGRRRIRDAGGEILTILADGNDYKGCVKDGLLNANQMSETNAVDANGNRLNPGRELVEQQTGLDVFPITTCPLLFQDLQTEGVCPLNATTGKWECPAVMRRCSYEDELGNTTDTMQICGQRGSASGAPSRSAAGRLDRITSTRSSFWSDDTPPKMLGTIGITNDEWHMFTITTHPESGKKGFVTYIDGVTRAALPYITGVGQDATVPGLPVNGGDPIDPTGPFRFCGREKPGDWSGEAGAVFDPERYSNVELAHFSVYGEAMTGVQVEALRQEYFKQFFPKRVEGYSMTPGACRGPGGVNDKVNSKYKKEMSTLDACAKECNDNAGQCKGFAYSPTSNNGECLIYGPGFSGSCSVTSATSPTGCEALGTCSDAAKTSEDTCGACSLPSATTDATCAQIGGTWTPATWTSSNAVWTGPSDGWLSDYFSSDLVVGVVAAGSEGDYTCYDVDTKDHHAKCAGQVAEVNVTSYLCTEADVNNGEPGCADTGRYKCAVSTCGSNDCDDCNHDEGSAMDQVCAWGCEYCADVCWSLARQPVDGEVLYDGTCSHVFLGLRQDQKTAVMCPEGCTFTAEVRAANVAVVHSAAVQRNGWTILAGVCRSEGDAMTVESKPNGRYSKTAGANGGPATQSECMDHCASEKDCIGYAHADNSWCLLYGPNMHDVGSSTVWTSDNHVAVTITQTKPNPAYICGTKDPTAAPTAVPTAQPTAAASTPPVTTTTPPTPAPTVADKVDSKLESMCRRGAIAVVSLWLTSLFQ